jgi:GWxTD domain-containing protein
MNCLDMKMKIKTISVYLAFLLLVACVPTSYEQTPVRQQKPNYASLYNPASANIQPAVRYYHASESKTFVFFRINVNRMMPAPKSATDQSGKKHLGVKYAIRHSETREIVDSAQLSYTLGDEEKSLFITYIPVELEAGATYFASMIFIDKNKRSHKRLIFDIDKTDPANGNALFPEFILPEVQPVFGNFLSARRPFKITSDIITRDSIKMAVYKHDSVLPAPPYKTGNNVFYPDQPIVEKFYHFGDTIWPDTSGFYCFAADSINPDGLSLWVGAEFFPWVRTSKDMLGPVRYIATGSKYRSLEKSEDLKLALDRFWLNTGRSEEQARELIRVFYNRVQQANRFFTATRPGWQTDRGMVYILLGAPQKVHKDESKEIWVYGKTDNYQGLVFRFVKDDKSLSNNEFLLIRDARYKDAWTDAVSSWRNGYPYSAANQKSK